MPRLSPQFLQHARRENSLLAVLLRTCRDLPSARNELRWLRENVERLSKGSRLNHTNKQWLRSLCRDRGRGKPLQYILGSQPFGDLDIRCRPGVLIPRPETEAYTIALANALTERYKKPTTSSTGSSNSLRILDLCTGTGCIALLLHQLLSSHVPILSILGIDIADKTLALANHNLRLNIAKGNLLPRASAQVRFSQADIFAKDAVPEGKWDIVISNPPYISPKGFDSTTERSVRKYEPREALVPNLACRASAGVQDLQNLDDAVGDAFYPRLLAIAQQVESQCLVMEVADMAQAQRVVSRAFETGSWSKCEIWRDWPETQAEKREVLELDGEKVQVRGVGNGRAVVLWR